MEPRCAATWPFSGSRCKGRQQLEKDAQLLLHQLASMSCARCCCCCREASAMRFSSVCTAHPVLLHTHTACLPACLPACLFPQVESRTVVAAGALVPPGTVIPSGQVWAGSPAKFIRNLVEGEAHCARWERSVHAGKPGHAGCIAGAALKLALCCGGCHAACGNLGRCRGARKPSAAGVFLPRACC